MVARKGDGSMRDSLSCFDQVLAFCGNQVLDDDVATLVGVVDRRLLADMSAAVLNGDTQAALEGVGRVDSFGYNIRQFTQELIAHFRGLLVIRSVPNPAGILDLAEAELDELRRQAEAHEPQAIQRRLTLLVKAEAEMAQASFPRLLLEMALLKMATLQPVLPVQQLIERIKALETSAAATPELWRNPAQQSVPVARQHQTPASAGPSTPTAAAAAPAGQTAGGAWERFVAFCLERKPAVGALLEYGSPLRCSPDRIEVGFDEGSYYLTCLQDSETLQSVRELAAEFNHQPTVVTITSVAAGDGQGPQSLAEKKKHDDEQRLNTARREAAEHPLLVASLKVLGGEIVEVKPL
jgi:DNA polymerase-3 subunit gamma/tau